MTHAQIMDIAGRVQSEIPGSRIYRSQWSVCVFGPNKVEQFGRLVDERHFGASRKGNTKIWNIHRPYEGGSK